MAAMSETETPEVRNEVADDDAEARSLVVRHAARRQLAAGQDLSTRLVGAATDASIAMTRSPATVITEIRGGATLPAALGRTGTSVRVAVGAAGDSARSAVGDYVNAQAALPNAVVIGAVDVAESVLRAQGALATSALTTVFTIAATATGGDDVRSAFDRERVVLTAQRDTARNDVTASWDRALVGLRSR